MKRDDIKNINRICCWEDATVATAGGLPLLGASKTVRVNEFPRKNSSTSDSNTHHRAKVMAVCCMMAFTLFFRKRFLQIKKGEISHANSRSLDPIAFSILILV